ncbi:G patch domain-containing protein 4 [Drosophila ficusphila]|uniref:G patch domain-containing protein 4 n=1 Tax=Drosophila ficusphila TaxID=30025 RepID=UPI0007E5E28D|nr:G patch domain-containing protein 4 [Drosophila ficusphila]
MDFAKKILGKYGWKEGDGLGKNNTGIAAPLKASLKFDNAGLGVDRAQEFNDHWWERCFNEAASNVDVQVRQDGQVCTSRRKGEDAVEISTSGFSARKLKKAKEQHAIDGKTTYDNFLQTSLLTQSGGEVENTERIKVEDIEVTKVSVLTDEELFKACGGRTAHKGARHGLKLSGKIARLEQQEREMLEKLQGKLNTASDPKKKNKRESAEDLPVEDQKCRKDDSVEQPKKKKKSKKEEPLEQEAVEQPEQSVKTKKKKNKAGKSEQDVQDQTQEVNDEEPLKIKKKKNRAKTHQEVSEETEQPTQGDGLEETQTSKKKRKTKDSTEEPEAPSKIKKKKKNIREEEQ